MGDETLSARLEKSLTHVAKINGERELGGVTNSVELTEHLLGRYPGRDFAFALGADLVDPASNWPGFDRIAQSMPIEIVPRGGYGSPANSIMPTMSSSDVRARIHAGESVEALLPCGVAAYIKRHELYASPIQSELQEPDQA